MTDWKPLRQMLPQLANADPLPPPLPRPRSKKQSNYAFRRSPKRLTQSLKVMLWILLGTLIVNLASDFQQLSLAKSGSITTEAATANDARQRMMAFLYLGAFIPTGILFLRWIHRATLNCRGFTSGMNFTPGWSIGFYFIPFMNLFKPYQAMKEIWQVSRDPFSWQVQATPFILKAWWTLWISSALLTRISLRMKGRVTSPDTLVDATIVSITSSLVDILLIIVAVTMISRISKMQEKLTQTADFEN